MAVGQQLLVDDGGTRGFSAQIDPRPSGLQDRRQPVGYSWRLRGRNELCERRRGPGSERSQLHDLLWRKLSRQDARGRMVGADDDRRRDAADPDTVAVRPGRRLIPGYLPGT